MSKLILLCLMAVCAGALAEDQYTDRYDNVDLDEILANRRLLLPYVKCLLDEGKCSPDAKELKDHVKEALETECSKCSEKQKTATRKVIKHLINNEPEYWAQASAKYDPQQTFSKKYEEELKAAKIA